MEIEWIISTNGSSDPRHTWYCHRIPANCPDIYYFVIHSGFVSQKLLQVAVNCLYCASEPSKIFMNAEWTGPILLWGSLLANGALDTSFGSRNMTLWFLNALFWGIFGTCFWCILSCQEESTCWDNIIASDNQVLDPSKYLRGLRICQGPHIPSPFVPSGQCTNKNVHSLHASKPVTVWHDLSRYSVSYCFLTPSFVLLGNSAKSRCLIKLPRLSLLSRQVKTACFIFKIARYWTLFDQSRPNSWSGSPVVIFSPS